MSFVHCHVHSYYSLLDGFSSPDILAGRAKELGMSACAITDHNALYGIPQWVKSCEKHGIKPLIGIELYYTPDISELSKPIEIRRSDAISRALAAGKFTEEWLHSKKTRKCDITEAIKPFMYDTKSYHILFIAKNAAGWHNLVKLQSEAARLCTFNARFHVDIPLIRKYHEGLICTNACISSYSAVMLRNGNVNEADSYINEMADIFGEDFYLEIQPLNIREQWITNLYHMDKAKELGLKAIATNDVHWAMKEDYDDHEVLLCIGTGAKLADENRMSYSNDFWFKSEEEMIESFTEQSASMYQEFVNIKLEDYVRFWYGAMQETQKLTNKVEDSIPLGADKPLFPKVEVPDGFNSPEEYLTSLSSEGLGKYLAEHPELDEQVYTQRLVEELEVINGKGFAPYMLTVYEYINWCARNNILTGPGRGSAAGSLVLFCLGITKIADPIKFKLWFSRFLTKDRKSLPDIDCDVQWEFRQDVIHHLEDFYGKENVAHIGTFSVEGVKSGITDIGRVMGIPVADVKGITKKLDMLMNSAPSYSFKDLDALKNSDEEKYRQFKELEQANPEIFRLARKIEGTPRNTGVHASGILVSPLPVSDITPLLYDKSGTAVTLYTGPQVEEQGCVKLDVLGLKNLDIIHKTLDSIGKPIGELYQEIAGLDDPKVFKMIAAGNTDAIFQLSSDIMKELVKEMQVSAFDDIVATNALARPGPLSAGFGHMYSKGKRGQTISPPIRGCEDLLESTYNVVCYQEQLNKLAVWEAIPIWHRAISVEPYMRQYRDNCMAQKPCSIVTRRG